MAKKKARAPKAKAKNPRSRSPRKAAKRNKLQRVVILFEDALDIPQTKGWVDKPGKWGELRQYGLKELVPMFADVDVVDRLELSGRRREPRYPWPNFRNYFRLYLRSSGRAVVRALQTWRGVVRLAYEDREPIPAGASHALCLNHSSHVDHAPTGVDAACAWKFLGGNGEGQFCVDVETGWNTNHSRLAHLTNPPNPPRASLLCGRHELGGIKHGTCVLGILCGTNQLGGCEGIAPGIAGLRLASYVSEVDPPPGVLPVPADNQSTDVAENIYAAVAHGINFLRARGGGILLIEYQTADCVPLEVLPAMRDLLESAKPDVTVVEAAGNGNHDLDSYQDPYGGNNALILHRPRGADDSGAIMVGAARSLPTGTKHDRLFVNQQSGSNFGSRLDCYAWGEKIGTPTSATSAGASNECELFGGTSGAAAIIAGVAVVVRGVAMAAGKKLNAPELRDILRKADHGTACTDCARIGSMPDLALILKRAVLGVQPRARGG